MPAAAGPRAAHALAATDREHEEAMYHLGNLLGLDTSNPPGNEAAAVRYVAGVLGAERVPFEVVEPVPGRASLVARLSAHRPDEALLLSAHTDVVPADPAGWTHPPFGGRVADGFAWGRGALDMKHMLAQSLMAVLIANRRGLVLGRDLVLAAVADGEQGCANGSLHLAARRPDLLRARFCLTEAGGFNLRVGERVLVPVGVATKGFAWLRVTAKGEGGHGSMPDEESAVWRLMGALRRIESGLVEQRLCGASIDFMDAVAACLPGARGLAVHALKVGSSSAFLRRVMPDREQSRYFAAITHDTAAVTILRAGSSENVIADTAEAIVDLRVLPGRPVAQAVEALAARLGDDVDVTVIRSGAATVSERRTPMWDLIEDAIGRALPEARVAPWILPGFSDAMAWSSLGITTYGFAPVLLPPGFSYSKLVHAADERVPVDGFRWGLDVLLDVVAGWCCR